MLFPTVGYYTFLIDLALCFSQPLTQLYALESVNIKMWTRDSKKNTERRGAGSLFGEGGGGICVDFSHQEK